MSKARYFSAFVQQLHSITQKMKLSTPVAKVAIERMKEGKMECIGKSIIISYSIDLYKKKIHFHHTPKQGSIYPKKIV